MPIHSARAPRPDIYALRQDQRTLLWQSAGKKCHKNHPGRARKPEDLELVIVDTQGRHALEADLIKEIIEPNTLTKATHRWLVIDAALGQQASEQARRFHEAIDIDGVIITKMDGTAKGGGALSAVAETKSGIVFIGSGETIEDLERFDPDGFISRLLGMGDLKALAERAEEAIKAENVDVNAMMKGKFTLRDMYTQLKRSTRWAPSSRSWACSRWVTCNFLTGFMMSPAPRWCATASLWIQ